MSGIKKFTVNGTDASIAMASDSNAGFMSSEQYSFIEGIRGNGDGASGIDASVIKYDNKTTGMDPVFDSSTMESVGWTSGKPVTVDTAIDVLAKKQADLETHLSGLMFDVSEANGGEPFDTLSDALAYADSVLLDNQKKGGMTIKYVQSSDNKYIRYNLLADSFTTDTTQWVIADNGVYVDNSEFVRVYTDSNDRILWAIKADGDIYFGAGVPIQVKDYIQSKISELSLDEYEKIVTFLGSLIEGDTLDTLLDSKVDSVEGKSLIDAEYATGISYVENMDFATVYVDNDNKILFGVRTDGDIYFGYGVPTQIAEAVQAETARAIEAENALGTFVDSPEYLNVITDSENKIIEGITVDGKKHISQFDENTENIIKEIAAGGSSLGNVIEISKLDGAFTSPVPVTITGTKGDENAKYEFVLPLSDDAFNVRFKFKITENLLNQGKSAVIASVNGADVTVEPVPLTQYQSEVEFEGNTKTVNWPTTDGGIKFNDGPILKAYNKQHLGQQAFSVKYTGEEAEGAEMINATIENTGEALVFVIDGVTTTYSFSQYPTCNELYAAIKDDIDNNNIDLELYALAIDERSCNELAKFAPIALRGKFYCGDHGAYGSSVVIEEHIDSAPFYLRYAVSDEWHQVEIVKTGGKIYSTCDANFLIIDEPQNDNILTLGGECGVLFKDFEVHTDNVGDAEIIPIGSSLIHIVSSVNPYVIIFEGHGSYTEPAYTARGGGDDSKVPGGHLCSMNIDTMDYIFSKLKRNGYIPVSILEVSDWIKGGKMLPKRCYTMTYDGVRWPWCLDLNLRSVFNRYGAKPALAIEFRVFDADSYKPIYNGEEITKQDAVSICKTAGFDLISHTKDHRSFNSIKPSQCREYLQDDIYTAEKWGVRGTIHVLPGGGIDAYMPDVMEDVGMECAIGVHGQSFNKNILYANRFYLPRNDISASIKADSTQYPYSAFMRQII